MPRRYQKKKQSFGKRIVKAGKYAYKHRSTAVKAYNLATKLARMVNVEYKFRITQNVTAPDNSGFVVNLTNIASGDLATERDGNSIKLMRLAGRVWITQNGSAQKTAVRVIIFRGKNERSQPYEVDDNSNGMAVLDASAPQCIIAPKLEDNKYDTKILFDKTYHMSNNGNSSILCNWNFKLFGHTTFQDQSATIENGGLYMLVVSNEGTNTPTFNYCLRTSYTDN